MSLYTTPRTDRRCPRLSQATGCFPSSRLSPATGCRVRTLVSAPSTVKKVYRGHVPRVCLLLQYLCVFITAGPSTKLFTWGGGDMGGHVLRETTSRGLCGLVCPSRTSERGGEGDCVKEGGGEEGKCERERALERLRYYSPGH
jgi:hypothetical protein